MMKTKKKLTLKDLKSIKGGKRKENPEVWESSNETTDGGKSTVKQICDDI